MKLLGEEGAVITMSGHYAVQAMAEGMVIEQVQMQNVRVAKGARVRLQNCSVQGGVGVAVSVEGTAIIQSCIIQDSQGVGLDVEPTGVATVTGTTIRRHQLGVFVGGKATIGAGCSIIDCTNSGIVAFKHEEGPGEVTVVGTDLVCKGDTDDNEELEGDFVCMQGGTIKGIAEEKIVTF